MLICCRVFIFYMIICAFLYPISLEYLGKVLFPFQAQGSLLRNNQQVIGSVLLGQSFQNPAYFWPRPSNTPIFPYNANHSAGSTSFPADPLVLEQVNQRLKLFHSTQKLALRPATPPELIFGSASGLDPHVSPLGAEYQATRVAQARKVPLSTILNIVNQPNLRDGDCCVNVLRLNQQLDTLYPSLSQVNR